VSNSAWSTPDVREGPAVSTGPSVIVVDADGKWMLNTE